MNNLKDQFSELSKLYKETLLEDIVPFWTKHAIDREMGCINNCVDDLGNILSKNKYLWSQGRALWTFSALYNRISPKQEWLDIAHGLFRYLRNNGRDSEGKWMYLLDNDGNVLETDTSIYVDGFVMNGMCEYYIATKNPEAAKIAGETYENVLSRIKKPGSYRTAPYEIPEGMKVHGVNMIYSFFFYNLGRALGREDICEAGKKLAREVLTDFYDSEKDAVLEYVTLSGKRTDTPLGRVCIPGHVIECMWFLITIFEAEGETETVKKCCDLIKRHIELGWDNEYEGILLAVDIEGKMPVAWNKHDYKPWWVQLEGMVATAYAYVHTEDDWFMKWHLKLRDYAYSHYPVPEGEWVQWLDRKGNKGESAALPVKDPFHLPRALIYLTNLLEKEL